MLLLLLQGGAAAAVRWLLLPLESAKAATSAGFMCACLGFKVHHLGVFGLRSSVLGLGLEAAVAAGWLHLLLL